MDVEEDGGGSAQKRESQGESHGTKRIKTLSLSADGKWEEDEEDEESVEFSDSDDDKKSGATESKDVGLTSAQKREPQGESHGTKRIKTLSLSADGKWEEDEEDEESVEFSDSDDDKKSEATESKDVGLTVVDTSQECNEAASSIPLLWSGNKPLEQQTETVASDESDEELLMSPWMQKSQAEATCDVVEGTETKEEIHANLSEASESQMQEPAPEVQADSVIVGDPDIEQDLQADIDEESDTQMHEPAEDTGPAALDYEPGGLLAWLLRPTQGVDTESEGSVEDSDMDDINEEVDDINEEDGSESESKNAEPKRMPKPSVLDSSTACSKPPTSVTEQTAYEKSAVDCRESRRKVIRQMPKLRGSVRLCFRSAPSCDDKSEETSPGEGIALRMPGMASGPYRLCFPSDEDLEEERSPEEGTALPMPSRPATPDDEPSVAMRVLARHVVRLRVAGPALERAVILAVQRAAQSAAESKSKEFRHWQWLVKPGGMQAYMQEKRRVHQLFVRCGGDLRRADEENRKLIPNIAAPAPSGNAPAVGLPIFMRQGMVNLPIPELRFAHDSQREHFGHKASSRSSLVHHSVLQLTVELLSGLTSPADVSTFHACHHNGLWFCHSGNRRLAAFQLAHRFAPERFSRLMLPTVPADDIFLRGSASTQQRLTTGRNGADCNGRWLFFVETGEAVGRVTLGCKEYGSDLLALLPKVDVPQPLLQGSGVLPTVDSQTVKQGPNGVVPNTIIKSGGLQSVNSQAVKNRTAGVTPNIIPNSGGPQIVNSQAVHRGHAGVRPNIISKSGSLPTASSQALHWGPAGVMPNKIPKSGSLPTANSQALHRGPAGVMSSTIPKSVGLQTVNSQAVHRGPSGVRPSSIFKPCGLQHANSQAVHRGPAGVVANMIPKSVVKPTVNVQAVHQGPSSAALNATPKFGGMPRPGGVMPSTISQNVHRGKAAGVPNVISRHVHGVKANLGAATAGA